MPLISVWLVVMVMVMVMVMVSVHALFVLPISAPPPTFSALFYYVLTSALVDDGLVAAFPSKVF